MPHKKNRIRRASASYRGKQISMDIHNIHKTMKVSNRLLGKKKRR